MKTKTKKLYEGKAKILWKSTGGLISEFKDDATAFDGEKKDIISGKGKINCQISAKLFELLEKKGIKTHFIRLLSENEMLVKELEILQIEVVCRNIATGSLVKQYPFEEGQELKPLIQFFYKSDHYHDPLINDEVIFALNLATSQELKELRELALKINKILQDFFSKKDIILVDFKLEFGKHNGEILLGDEISPDTCRFWDAKTRESLDKDRFRFEKGKIKWAYEEMYSRIFGDS